MAAFNGRDILFELIELLMELIQDVQQELVYYRASVYKSESAKTINKKISQLKLVGKLTGIDAIYDSFCDFEATEINGNQVTIPGECSFSTRVVRLLADLTVHYQETVNQIQETRSLTNPDMTRQVKRHRKQLLSICRQGSRHWSFFQTI